MSIFGTIKYYYQAIKNRRKYVIEGQKVTVSYVYNPLYMQRSIFVRRDDPRFPVPYGYDRFGYILLDDSTDEYLCGYVYENRRKFTVADIIITNYNNYFPYYTITDHPLPNPLHLILPSKKSLIIYYQSKENYGYFKTPKNMSYVYEKINKIYAPITTSDIFPDKEVTKTNGIDYILNKQIL